MNWIKYLILFCIITSISLILKCADEEEDAEDSNSLNGGYGKPSMSPYEDDDLGKLNSDDEILFYN